MVSPQVVFTLLNCFSLINMLSHLDCNEVESTLRGQCLSNECLRATWWSIHEDASWRCDPHPLEGVRVFNGPLNSLLEFLFDAGLTANVGPIHLEVKK